MLAFFIGFIIGIIFTIVSLIVATLYLIGHDEDKRSYEMGLYNDYDYET